MWPPDESDVGIRVWSLGSWWRQGRAGWGPAPGGRGGRTPGPYLLLGAELSRLARFSSQSSRWTSGSSATSNGHSLARLSSGGTDRRANEGHTHSHAPTWQVEPSGVGGHRLGGQERSLWPVSTCSHLPPQAAPCFLINGDLTMAAPSFLEVDTG